MSLINVARRAEFRFVAIPSAGKQIPNGIALDRTGIPICGFYGEICSELYAVLWHSNVFQCACNS